MWTCDGCGLQGLDCMCPHEANDIFEATFLSSPMARMEGPTK